MQQEAYQRLKPFLHRKSARNKIILYLLAEGYTVGELRRLDVASLRKLSLPTELLAARARIVRGRAGGCAFVYKKSKKALPYTDYYRLLRIAGEHALGRRMSCEKLRRYLYKNFPE